MRKSIFKICVLTLIALVGVGFVACKKKDSKNDPYAEVYADAAVINGAGIDWEDNSFALTEHVIDETLGTSISAGNLISLMVNGGINSSAVYIVEDEISLSSDVTYNGKGASIIANAGINIEGEDNIKLSNIIIKGSVNVYNSVSITLEKVDIQGISMAINVSGMCSDILFKDCRITANDVAVNAKGDETAIYKSYISATKGVLIDADDVIVQNCHIATTGQAVQGNGKGIIVRENLIEVPQKVTGILLDDAYNALVTLNIVRGSQKSIVVNAGYNCSITLNSAIRIVGTNNKNLYVINNNIGGRIILENNNYLICDDNSTPNDTKNHQIYMVENKNINGDNITDVNARLSVGANEEILPHTNKDLFVGMERRDTIRDLDVNKRVSLQEYIKNNIDDGFAVVPPGAYLTNENIILSSHYNNLEIYAYGVMHEKMDYGETLRFTNCNDIKMYGLTLGYVKQSSGQVHVIDKLGSNKLLVVPAAGYENTFVKENGGVYDWFTKQADGSTGLYPIADLSHTIVDNGNGTATMTLTGSDVSEYSNIHTGDIVTCRLYGANGTSVVVGTSKDIVLKDVVIYGYSNALSILSASGAGRVELNRVHNTARSSLIIDRETYNKYKSWEDMYNVDLEIYIDENGNYRGSLPRIGSVDATHVTKSDCGINVVSCKFDFMTDDGSNHNGKSSRLHSIVDNGDGTTSIYYKGSLSEYYHKNGGGVSACTNFEKGNHIFAVSASTGKILCDTTCLDNAQQGIELKFTIDEREYSTFVYKVLVATKDVDFSAVEGIDLSDNHYKMDNKILVDNISKNSAGFSFDNTLIANKRARGILVKTRDASIKNCTFRNIAGTGILMSIESIWGESTFAKNVNIEKCLFDHVGYINRSYTVGTHSPICISGIGEDIANINLACSDIRIDGCKFVNNEHERAITIYAAQNIKITNNDFGYRVVNGEHAVGIAVNMHSVKNILIDGNKYVDQVLDITAVIKGTNYMNLTGKDTIGESGQSLFPDKISK